MRKLLLLLCCSVPVFAQAPVNYISITTTNANEISDAGGTGISGTFCAYATDTTDTPMAFTVASAYSAVRSTVCRNVVAGQLTSPLLVANPAATNPTNVRYHVVVVNSTTHQITHYPAVLISVPNGTSTWDWSTWNPSSVSSLPLNNIAATVAVGSTTTGAPGSSAAVSNAGTSNAALLNFTIPTGATGATGATGGAANIANASAGLPPVYTGTNTIGPATASTQYPASITAAPLASNAIAPPAYNMPQFPGFKFPLLQTANCTSSSGISNVATGITATSAGTTGNCTITFPFVIDPTQEFHLAVLVTDSETGSNGTNIRFDSSSTGTRGSFFALGASGNVTAIDAGNVGSALNGSLTSVPAGTQMWFTVNSDGTRWYACMIPATLTTLDTNHSANAAWDGSQYCGAIGSQYVDSTNGPVMNGVNELLIQIASNLNVVNGTWFCYGKVDCNPTDGAFTPPSFVGPTPSIQSPTYAAALSTSAVCSFSRGTCAGNETLIPGTYGSKTTNLIAYMHQNGSTGINTNARASVASLFNNGYGILSINENGNNCVNDALGCNWGSPTGQFVRKRAIDFTKQKFPALGQLGLYGTSMGCEDALEYERLFPGAFAFYGASCVTSLQNAWNQTTPWTAQSAILNVAYGSLYVALQGSTNQNPASSPTFWAPVAPTVSAAPEGTFNAPDHNWKAVWSSGSTYSTGDMVSLSRSDVSFPAALNPYDPLQNVSLVPTYRTMPMFFSYSDPADSPGDLTLDSSHQSAAFATAISGIGGNVTTYHPVNNASGHLTSDIFVATDIVNFFNTYSSKNPARFPASSAAAISTGSTSNTCLNKPLTYFVVTATSQGTSALKSLPFSFHICPGQSMKVQCSFIYQVAGTNDRMTVGLSGPSLSGSPNGSVSGHLVSEVNVASGVPTYSASAIAAAGTSYPTLNGTTNAGVSATNLDAEAWFDVRNGSVDGFLIPQFADSAGLANATIEPNSSCTAYPAF